MKKFKYNIKSKLFLRYFLIFVSITLGLLILFSMFFSGFIMKRFIKIMESHHTLTAQSQITEIQQSLSAIEDSIYQLQNSPDNIPYLLKNDPSTAMRFVNSLCSFATVNPEILDVGIYYREYEDFLICSAGTTNLTVYTESHLKNGWTAEEFRNTLKNTSSPQLLLCTPGKPEYNSKILFLSPLPYAQQNGYGLAFFVLDPSLFTGSVLHILQEYHSFVYITADENLSRNYFYYSDRVPLTDSSSRLDEYLLIEKDFYQNFQYTIGISQRDLFEQVHFLWFIFLAVMLLLSVLSTFFAYVLSYRLYKPIHRISMNIGSKPRQHVDELSLISDTVSELMDMKNDTLNVIDEVRNQVFRSLLYSPVENSFQLEQLLNFAQLTKLKTYYTVVVVTSASRAHLSVLIEQFVEHLDNYDDIDVLYRELTDASLILLINTEYSNAAEIQQIFLQCSGLLLQDEYVCIGSVTKSLYHINRSYHDAVLVSAFSRFDPTVKVLDNTNISSVSQGMYTYPKAEEKRLLNSVTTQNTERVLVTLCDIIRKVRVQQLSDKVCKSIYISILNNLKNELEEVHCNTTAFLAEIQKYMLAAHTCAADIHNDFSMIIYHLALVMEQNPSVSDGASFAEKISAYIQQNLHDYALSLNTVAEYVHKSPSYVTKLYREQTGYTVKESIDIARISLAKKLLLEPAGLTLSQIACKAGFVDVSSFCRKFKSMVGVTPTHYRQQ